MKRVRKIPQRMCVACRQMRPKREMLRVVRPPAGDVRVDPTGKAAGRGAYVDPTEACIEVAMRERRLQHALEAEIPSSLGEELRARLAQVQVPPQPRVIRIAASDLAARLGRDAASSRGRGRPRAGRT